jgi:hypothetical protein
MSLSTSLILIAAIAGGIYAYKTFSSTTDTSTTSFTSSDPHAFVMTDETRKASGGYKPGFGHDLVMDRPANPYVKFGTAPDAGPIVLPGFAPRTVSF